MNEYLRESARAGALIQEKVGQVHTGVNRGVIQYNNLAVLNTARRPAVLFEMGYATNPSDAKLLTTPASQRNLARAISDALVEYLREYERRTGVTPASGDAP
jgi:N-acetylmuramoyl-L-alanine amidase